MAARSDSLLSRPQSWRVTVADTEGHVLSLDQRVARLQRRRRLSTAAAALEGVVWLAGAVAVAAIAVAGLTGLH